MFTKAVPVLPAVNISATIEFYKCKLGFSKKFWQLCNSKKQGCRNTCNDGGQQDKI